MRQAPLIERALRKSRTGRALAQAIGWHESQISHWKNGREPMPDDAIAAIAVYLGEDPIKVLADERGGAWKRVAHALREKVSAGFDWLLLHANPRRSLPSAG